MKVEKRGNSYRVQKMVDGKRISKTFNHKPTKRELEEAMAEVLNRSVTQNSAPKTSFYSCAENYLAIKENVLSPSTIRSYNTILKNLDKDFVRLPLNKISQIEVQRVINVLAADHNPKTVRNYHAFISAVLQLYRPDFQLHTTLPQKIKTETRIPTDEEIKAILEDCKGKSYELAIRLGVYGMRRGEVCAVTSDDIKGNMLSINKVLVQDKDNKFILKPYPKTSESQRQIYIDDECVKLLKKQKKGFNGHPDKILEYLKATEKRLGIEPFKYHALRHYYASMAHALGIPDSYIMKAGGWASDNVLRTVYRHAQKDKEEDMMKFAAEYMKDTLLK